MTDFKNLPSALGEALNKRGYETLTPVQNAVLLPDLQTKDLLVSAQTGSGKTVAFGLAIAPTLLDGAEKLGKVKKPLALVIAPTRELALQVKQELAWLYEESGAAVTSCVGGMDIRKERQALQKGAHIVVGTPGRLRDHIERGYFDTSALKAVVLDEADEMLDMGFRKELSYILDTAPVERRTLLFSATVPKAIASLAKRYQRDAERITTKEEEKQHSDIEYQALTIAPNDRENAIINLLRYYESQNSIVFCGTRAAVNHMTSRLTNRGFSVVALSGELSQAERSHALQALRDGRARVCVATDVAARGIDLPHLELVIHADIPKNKDLLLHRSGRTGRAGRKGVSALIVPYNMRRRTEYLLQNAKIEAKWGKPPSISSIIERDRERFLASPALSEPIKDDEQKFAKELIERYGPEQIAAALIRMNDAQNPAPEELLDTAPSEGGKKSRETFKKGVWVSLSVGRKSSAEPRWILPLLCGAGHLTRRQIGAIRIHETETYVELSPECIEGFLTAIGPTGKIEKNIAVTALDGAPPDTAPPAYDRKKRPKKHEHRKKPYEGRRQDSSENNAGGPKRDFKKKKYDGDASFPPKKKKKDYKHKSDEPSSYFSKGKPEQGSGPKGKSFGPKGGEQPLKRKKPRHKSRDKKPV